MAEEPTSQEWAVVATASDLAKHNHRLLVQAGTPSRYVVRAAAAAARTAHIHTADLALAARRR